MRLSWILLLLLTGYAFAASVSEKRSRKAFEDAARLVDNGRFEEAEQVLDQLIASDSLNQTYLFARESLHQRYAAALLERGNRDLAMGLSRSAQQLFAQAYSFDPKNEYARQRFLDARATTGRKIEVLEFDEQPQLSPTPGTRSFDYRGDGRGLVELFARQFGLKPEFDQSFSPRALRFTLPNVDFATALRAVKAATNAFIVPLDRQHFLVAADRTEDRRRLERYSLRTFYVPDGSGPQDLIEVVNVLRMMFELRQIMPNQATSTVTVRAPAAALDAAQSLLQSLSVGRSEVLIDIQVLQISQSRSTNIGVQLPLQFTAFNLNTELRNLINDPNIQSLIDQLTAGGTLSAADAAALAALVSAAQNASSPLLQGFATFGGGISRTGLAIPPSGINFKLNSSDVRIFQRVTMRTQHGKPATYRIGERYPVLTGTFSPLLSIPLPSSLQRQNNAQPLTPSFNYEDLGITFKATPSVTSTGEMRIDFDLALRALAGQTFNGVPAISNRQYVGSVGLMEGQTSIIAGSVNSTEQRSLRGLPFLSQIPGLRYAVSTTVKEKQDAQLLLLVTPHRVRSGHVDTAPEILLPPAGSAQ